MALQVLIKSNRLKGNLDYEYHPFRNLQDTNGKLIDFDTEKLNFDLSHPVEMEILPSYDGSVNVILNDDKNVPRLINSRFSVRKNGTYEIVDRIGENDTNVYSNENLDKDSSLYLLYSSNPIVSYQGFINGKLKVGLYCFYFSYCDKDDNESDYVAETGVIPVFIGSDGNIISVDGGIKNQESNKGIKLKLTNLDKGYNYLKVTYVRYFADLLQSRVTEAKKIILKYPFDDKTLILQITGNENSEDINPQIINISHFIANSVKTQALCKNMLFQANLTKNIDNYKELSDLALRIIPKAEELREDVDYSKSIDIVNKAAYMPGELYRFGVVFIYKNGTFSNVYNTLGYDMSASVVSYSGNIEWENREYIKIDSDGMLIDYTKFFGDKVTNANSKGVCKIPSKSLYKVTFQIPLEISRALKELGIKGYFFVRLKRLPLVITQMMLLPFDKYAEVPVLISNKENNDYNFCSETVVGLSYSYKRKLFNYRGNFREFNYTGEYTNSEGKKVSYKESISNQCFAGICPDFLLDLPYYNQIFNGGTFILEEVENLDSINKRENNRIYEYSHKNTIFGGNVKVKICSVTEDVKTVALRKQVFRLNAGVAEDITNFKVLGEPLDKDDDERTNIIRGTYSPYLAIEREENEYGELKYGSIYNVYLENSSFDIKLLFLERMNLSEPYYAISNKYELLDIEIPVPCYKGDAYYNEFTHRLNRNFNDPALANNDIIIGTNGNPVPDVEKMSDKKILIKTPESYYIYNFLNEGALRLCVQVGDDDRWSDSVYLINTENHTGNKGTNVNINVTSDNWIINFEIENKSYLFTKYREEVDDIQSLYITYYTHKHILIETDDLNNILEYTFIEENQSPFFYIFSKQQIYYYDNDVTKYYLSVPEGEEYGQLDLNIAPVYNYKKGSDTRRSDVNGVQLGTWITFKCFSSNNFNLRSVDHSNVAEKALMGSPRTFYPKTSKPWLGEFKMPDSYLYNDAYRASLGYKCYWSIEELNYLKNTFSNRIQYSSISIQDSFKNNYRESLNTYFRDYSNEYGSITKLVGFEGYLLVVLEHGIGLAVVNERIVAGQGDGDPVFINTNNVLPEELTIISDTYGSLWSESIIKSEAGYVYGVDTVAKKIWRVQGKLLELISDFKVNSFLVDNLTLGENDKTPIIGIKNVKTHYNNNKKDIMFTFYNNIYKEEDKVWNLCFNENLNTFTTFYSWIPGSSENIDTQFFSFNRTPMKDYALAAKHLENSGIKLSSPYIEDLYYGIDFVGDNIINKEGITLEYYRIDINGKIKTNPDGTTEIISKNEENKLNENITFELGKDPYGNYKLVKIDGNKLRFKNSETLRSFNKDSLYLEIIPKTEINGTTIYFKTEEIILIWTTANIVTEKKYNNWFYLHGDSGIFDVKEDLKPCYWYGELHPFEFEFIVNDKIGQLKMFENLIILSNKAEPESFHFEVEGDNYEFSSDKRTMYYRQEATKELYLSLGSDILFNRGYDNVRNSTGEEYYREDSNDYKDQYPKMDKVYPIYKEGLIKLVKSTIFPLYYERIDTYNEIYDKYCLMKSDDSMYNFLNLSGSEIGWNKKSNQFNIVTHIKNSPINLYGRLRGNSFYKEGKWNIQIPSIIFSLKNESLWNIPPIVINSLLIPDIIKTDISYEDIPNIYRNGNWVEHIDTTKWTNRKEAKIRDKWVRVRIRYSGKNLAIIHSIATLYNISYS